jgi:hypothetical protein
MSTFPFPSNPDHYSGFVAKPEEYMLLALAERSGERVLVYLYGGREQR